MFYQFLVWSATLATLLEWVWRAGRGAILGGAGFSFNNFLVFQSNRLKFGRGITLVTGFDNLV